MLSTIRIESLSREIREGLGGRHVNRRIKEN